MSDLRNREGAASNLAVDRSKLLHGLADSLVKRLTTALLVLGHVPLADVALAAPLTEEGPHALMLSQVDLEVTPCVVALGTAGVRAVELVDVLVRLLVVSQDPLLPVAVSAAGEAALELLYRLLLVRRHMVLQVLRHLEGLVAAWVRTVVVAHLQVGLEVLLLLRVLGEHLRAVSDRAEDEVAAVLRVIVDHTVPLAGRLLVFR